MILELKVSYREKPFLSVEAQFRSLERIVLERKLLNRELTARACFCYIFLPTRTWI